MDVKEISADFWKRLLESFGLRVQKASWLPRTSRHIEQSYTPLPLRICWYCPHSMSVGPERPSQRSPVTMVKLGRIIGLTMPLKKRFKAAPCNVGYDEDVCKSDSCRKWTILCNSPSICIAARLAAGGCSKITVLVKRETRHIINAAHTPRNAKMGQAHRSITGSVGLLPGQ